MRPHARHQPEVQIFQQLIHASIVLASALLASELLRGCYVLSPITV